jgi:hypothetical protein
MHVLADGKVPADQDGVEHLAVARLVGRRDRPTVTVGDLEPGLAAWWAQDVRRESQGVTVLGHLQSCGVTGRCPPVRAAGGMWHSLPAPSPWTSSCPAGLALRLSVHWLHEASQQGRCTGRGHQAQSETPYACRRVHRSSMHLLPVGPGSRRCHPASTVTTFPVSGPDVARRGCPRAVRRLSAMES